MESFNKGSALFGESEYESKRRLLREERQQDYKEHLKRLSEKEAEKAKEKKLNELRSAESEAVDKMTNGEEVVGENNEPVAENSEVDSVSSETPAVHKSTYYTTCRERLIDNFHGTAQCFPSNPYLPTHIDPKEDKYEYQQAYAEELRSQIEEKKMLDKQKEQREIAVEETLEETDDKQKRQLAYAEDLKCQIQEKKRLEANGRKGEVNGQERATTNYY